MDSLGRRLREAMNRSINEQDRQNLLVFLESLKLAVMDQIEAGDTALAYDLPGWVYEVRFPTNPLNEAWVAFEDWLRHNDLSCSIKSNKEYAGVAYGLVVYPSRFGPLRPKAEGDLGESWLDKLLAKQAPQVRDASQSDEPSDA